MGLLGARRVEVMELRMSSMLLPALSDLTLAAAREGVLAGWAVLDAKREVRVAGAVGVPLLPSRDSFRMLEMSSLAEVEWG